MNVEVRRLQREEINRELFQNFVRYQEVTNCWRKRNEEWVIEADPFVDDWNEEEYQFLIACLKNTIATGGIVLGVFYENQLKGFSSVESKLFGSELQYADLTSIHISKDLRGLGIGKRLFSMAAQWAGEHGAKKLYISAHSAVESQGFYRSLGCVEAKEYNMEHVECEPCDVQMEYMIQ